MKCLFKILKIAVPLISLGLCLIYCNKKTTAVVEIKNIDYITPATAMVFASVKADGGAEVTSRGVCWSTSENPDYSDNKTSNGEGEGAYSGSITNLSSETKYYVRAYATNSEGVGYSQQKYFTTASDFVPPIIGTEIISYTTSEAHIKGTISNEGGAMVKVCGICWSTSQDPDITDNLTTGGIAEGEYASLMPNLTANTKYFVKAYATTIVGTYYGNEISFTTLSESDGTVTDYDGNIYNVVNIGTQRWISENLKTTTLNDGTTLPQVADKKSWWDLVIPAYCIYDNDIVYKDTYGALYNGYAVETGKLCPSGWHVPRYHEWSILITYLGADTNGVPPHFSLAGMLRETGTSHWLAPNTGATNASGFTALPGGVRDRNCVLWDFDYCGLTTDNSFWTSTASIDDPNSFVYYGVNENGYNCWIGAFWDRQVGLSVRCLKDNEPH